MFDAHCHLDFERFDADRDDVVRRAVAAGVTELHVPGVAPAQWGRGAALEAEGIALGHGVGLHPWWIDGHAGGLELVEEATRTQAEAIGECGLDKPLAKRGGATLDVQEEVFRAHVEASRTTGLPLVIHVVGAHGRLLDVLEAAGPLPGGMIHSFTGPRELVGRYVKLGFALSFCASLTRSRRAQEAAAAVPSEWLLLETDGPDQPLAGEERSEPAHLPTVLATLARCRGEAEGVVAAATRDNARRLFRR